MENVRFVSIWRTEKPQDNYVTPKAHPYYELVYYASGGGVTTIADTQYDFTKNEFALIPPDAMHDERLSTSADIICLAFTCDTPLPVAVRGDRSRMILQILETIVEECALQGFDYESMVAAKLTELVIVLSRTSKYQKTRDKSLGHIIKYIDENYHEKIHMADCARQLQLSYSCFQNKFRQSTGLSPQNYLLKKRLKAARNLLLHSDLNCTEIALQCGFSTSAQFTLLFKKQYHVTPTVYRHQTDA